MPISDKGEASPRQRAENYPCAGGVLRKPNQTCLVACALQHGTSSWAIGRLPYPSPSSVQQLWPLFLLALKRFSFIVRIVVKT